MFREVRRKDRQLPDQEAQAYLKEGRFGVLCMIGDDGYPYGIPMNYLYDGEYIYVHGAKEGHKIDAVKKEPKVCFTVYGDTEELVEEVSTNYSSVVAFGTAQVISDEAPELRQQLAEILVYKYCGETDAARGYVAKAVDAATIIRIKVDHLTGKRRK